MLQKTAGIVISQVKYGESSLIIKIYTEVFGFKSYIVNNVRTKSSKTKSAYFRPLSMLDLVVYNKESSSIQRISEVKSLYTYASLPYDKNKILIGIFTAEVLSKTLKEEHPDADLFQFLVSSLIVLDKAKDDYVNFPLFFLLKLSSYLGFLPSSISDFYLSIPGLQLSLAEETVLDKLLIANDYTTIEITNTIRRCLINVVVNFYSAHLDNFTKLNSLVIIQEIL